MFSFPRNTPYFLIPLITLGIYAESVHAQVDVTRFDPAALVKAPVAVDCILQNGDNAQCAELMVSYLPPDLEIGPFCPSETSPTGGIWQWTGDADEGLYRINDDFLEMLADKGRNAHDGDGAYYDTGAASAQPTASNSCISASIDEAVQIRVLLPLTPIMAEYATDLATVTKVGLALDGVPIFADVPTTSSTGQMAALDTCGGHIDPGGWYHWHAPATDIASILSNAGISAECSVPQDPTALFGYAFDGFAIYGSQEADGSAPSDLDACQGHFGATEANPEGIYHYHTSVNFPGLPPCLSGVSALNNFSTSAAKGIGAVRAETDRATDDARPDLTQAAAQLGLSEKRLVDVLRAAGGRWLDVSVAAYALGVSETALQNALPTAPASHP